MSAITIITSTKNAKPDVERTLASVSEQDCTQMAHLIVDGNSQDGTLELVKDYPHCKPLHVTQQTGMGIANAFNTGLEQSSSKLVLFLNAGDTFVSHRAVSQIVASYCQHRWWWASGETIALSRRGWLRRHVRHRREWNRSRFLLGNPLCHQSTVYTADLIAQVGPYDEELFLGMDYEYNIRCSFIAPPHLLNFPIAYYDTTGVSSVRVLRSFAINRRIRNRFFSLSRAQRLGLDTRMLLKSVYRLGLVPLKLVL